MHTNSPFLIPKFIFFKIGSKGFIFFLFLSNFLSKKLNPNPSPIFPNLLANPPSNFSNLLTNPPSILSIFFRNLFFLLESVLIKDESFVFSELSLSDSFSLIFVLNSIEGKFSFFFFFF